MELFDLSSPNSYFWLVIGVFLIIFEVTALPGIGFLFAGLGAITLGGLLTFSLIDINGWFEHTAYFFFFTTIWAVILWTPLKRALHKNKGGYQNIVGTRAEMVEPLTSGKIGKVKWSGTLMRARISPDCQLDKIVEGETVWVVNNKGGVLEIDIEEPEGEEQVI